MVEDAPLGVQVSSDIIKKGEGGGGQSLGRHPYLEYTKSERKDVIEKK